MVEGKRVAVVVPAFEEELLVADTIRGIPDFVDRIVVVDDHSPDATAERARETRDPRLEVIVHAENGGVGAAIVTGYARCRELGGRRHLRDGGRQPDGPGELGALVGPVARGEVDYAKANRLVSGEAWTADPALALPRQRDALAADEDRVGLLARRRLAGGLHRALARARSAASTSTGSTAATGSRTTCSCT